MFWLKKLKLFVQFCNLNTVSDYKDIPGDLLVRCGNHERPQGKDLSEVDPPGHDTEDQGAKLKSYQVH